MCLTQLERELELNKITSLYSFVRKFNLIYDNCLKFCRLSKNEGGLTWKVYATAPGFKNLLKSKIREIFPKQADNLIGNRKSKRYITVYDQLYNDNNNQNNKNNKKQKYQLTL